MKKILFLISIFVLSLLLTSCNLKSSISSSNIDIDSTTNTDNDITTNELSDITTTDDISTTKRYRISTKDPYIDLYAGETAYVQYSTNFELEDGESIDFITWQY